MSAAADPVRGGDAVRTALVEAAASLLSDVGPRALTVRDVAKRAGVNHGQVHHYFGGKRALLEAAMKKLCEDHHAHAMAVSGGDPIPPALVLAGDPAYWRALCQVVMEGDMELARIEIDEDISVPRGALRAGMKRFGVDEDDLDFKAQFAAIMALNLGWVAFEPFVMLVAGVRDEDREELRTRLKALIDSLVERRSSWTSD